MLSQPLLWLPLWLRVDDRNGEEYSETVTVRTVHVVRLPACRVADTFDITFSWYPLGKRFFSVKHTVHPAPYTRDPF